MKKTVGRIGKGRKQTSIVLDAVLAAAIEKRAKALGITPSRFSALIVERWQAEGCPPISEPDRLMQIAAKAEASPKGGKKLA